MLTITVPEQELFDSQTNTFTQVGGITLELEHSLLSLSKWESKHQKPFLGNDDKTSDEIRSYIECMILTPNVDSQTLKFLGGDLLDQIARYMESKESATTFGEMPEPNKGKGETLTAELIYYWLVAFNIPFTCETWNLNRLFALVKICNIKQQKAAAGNGTKSKKPSREAMIRRQDLNEQRKQQLGTTG